MRTTRSILLGAGALLLLLSAAHAQNKVIAGRTGAPAVKAGVDRVWMETGRVDITTEGDQVVVTQTYRLHYPGPPLQGVPLTITTGVREDYYRSRENHGPSVVTAEARGFTDFGVWVDEQPVQSAVSDWHINDKNDTATRWHTWDIAFQPDQIHTMRIVSQAPIGRRFGRNLVEFVSKDLGHWRTPPDHFVITFHQPGVDHLMLAGLAPKPETVEGSAIRWEFNKAHPNRDISIEFPSTPETTAAR